MTQHQAPEVPTELRDDIEVDIRIAIWNAGMKGGMGQDLSQAFIKRAMVEPTMIRALEAATRATQPLSLTVEDGDGFEVEVGDDSYAILWPDGWWLDAHRNGKITIGKSPYDAATHPQQATLPALLDRLQSPSLPKDGANV